ncbi:MAG: Twin-arginine translocation protein TatA, partial [uncultured Rubellimicrobium sp.]
CYRISACPACCSSASSCSCCSGRARSRPSWARSAKASPPSRRAWTTAAARSRTRAPWPSATSPPQASAS